MSERLTSNALPTVEELSQQLAAAQAELAKTPARHVRVRAKREEEVALLARRIEYAASGIDYLVVQAGQTKRAAIRQALRYEVPGDILDMVVEDLASVDNSPLQAWEIASLARDRWRGKLPRRSPRVLAELARDEHFDHPQNGYHSHAAAWYHELDRAEVRRIREIRAGRARQRHVPKTRWERTKELIKLKAVDIGEQRAQPTLRKLGINYEEPIIGWERNRYGARPVRGTPVIAGRDFVRYALFCLRRDLRTQKRRPVPQDKLAERRTARDLELTVKEFREIANDPAALQARRAQLEEERRQAHAAVVCRHIEEHAHRVGCRVEDLAEQEQILLRFAAVWVRRCCEQLSDLRDADPAWLSEAIEAALSNESLKGRLSSWYRQGEVGLYEYLRGCLKVQRRHEQTNYDDLLASGYDKELARLLAVRSDG